LYDFALLTGPVLLGLGLALLTVAVKPARPGSRPLHLGLWGFWGLLALLDLSGSVRGEVGRIWIFLMPLAALFAAAALAAWPTRASRWAAGLAALELALLLSLAANLVFVS